MNVYTIKLIYIYIYIYIYILFKQTYSKIENLKKKSFRKLISL